MSKLTNEQIGIAVNNAAEYLPKGYRLHINIERFGYGVELISPKGEYIDCDTGSEDLPEEINDLIEIAQLIYEEESKQ